MIRSRNERSNHDCRQRQGYDGKQRATVSTALHLECASHLSRRELIIRGGRPLSIVGDFDVCNHIVEMGEAKVRPAMTVSRE